MSCVEECVIYKIHGNIIISREGEREEIGKYVVEDTDTLRSEEEEEVDGATATAATAAAAKR